MCAVISAAVRIGCSRVRHSGNWGELATFPIPEASEKEQAKIAKLSQLMLDLQKELQEATANTDKHARLKAEIEKLDRKIDQAIYKLYDLTDEEIKTIELQK